MQTKQFCFNLLKKTKEEKKTDDINQQSNKQQQQKIHDWLRETDKQICQSL